MKSFIGLKEHFSENSLVVVVNKAGLAQLTEGDLEMSYILCKSNRSCHYGM
jgi:hypothetical protein